MTIIPQKLNSSFLALGSIKNSQILWNIVYQNHYGLLGFSSQEKGCCCCGLLKGCWVVPRTFSVVWWGRTVLHRECNGVWMFVRSKRSQGRRRLWRDPSFLSSHQQAALFPGRPRRRPARHQGHFRRSPAKLPPATPCWSFLKQPVFPQRCLLTWTTMFMW